MDKHHKSIYRKDMRYLYKSILLLVVILLIFTSYTSIRLQKKVLHLKHAYITDKTTHDKPTVSSDKMFVSEALVQELYQILKDTTELLDKHGIRYVIDGGTVLGAVRHGGLIPWDDDADLLVLQEDESKIMGLVEEFFKMGYTIKYTGTMYVVTYQGTNDTPPFIDIMIIKKNSISNTYEYTNSVLRSTFSKEWYPAEYLFPRKSYDFGPLKLWGPNNAMWYLDHYYGTRWRTHAPVYNHSNNHISGGLKTIDVLTEELQKPALPRWPLVDRVDKIR